MLPQNPSDPALAPQAAPATPTSLDDATYRALLTGLQRRLGGDRALAQDLLQDSLLQFLRKQHTLRDDAAALAFLRTIIARRLADHFRRDLPGAVSAATDGLAAELPATTGPEVDADGLNESLGAYLGLVVAELPEPYREALTAVELRGQSQRAYAEAHGLAYSTAKSRVQRARQLLRRAVTDCCEVDADAYGNILAVRPRRRGCERPTP